VSPRHVPASVTELQRIGLFGSLPGETITKLAGRMVREEFSAGRAIASRMAGLRSASLNSLVSSSRENPCWIAS
jgi:hypothetical protein